jgi:hypothetical protein
MNKVPKVDALSDIFSDKIEEKNIQPEDSIEFNCEGNKSFFLLRQDEKKSVWIILPDREFRLKQTEGNQNIYSNDITTLEISPEKTQILNEKEVLYSQCVEKKDPS